MTFRQFAYRNVMRNVRIYAAFFMASVFSVMVFFLYSMLYFHPTIEDRFVQEVAIFGMGIAEIILYIFTLFFLFYSMRAFLQARSKEFGVLLQLGMRKKQLNLLIFLETMLLGIGAIAVGTSIGFLFSKFFFLVVQKIVALPNLPLYFSWKPFALTIGAFLSLFFIISIIAPFFLRNGKIVDFIQGEPEMTGEAPYSLARAYLGIVLLIIAYVLAALTSHQIILSLLIFLPPLATVATYLFFTDSVPFLLEMVKRIRPIYWRNYRLLSISDSVVNFKENARMFFLVTIVSTFAFMSVGTLASLTSFALQYRELHPIAMVYKSETLNPEEAMHIYQLQEQLQAQEVPYELIPFSVLQQTSTFKNSPIEILSVAQVNQLAQDLGYPSVALARGEALFLPPTTSSFEQLNNRVVTTTLKDSNQQVLIDGAYPHPIFSAYSVSINAIIINEEDFEAIYQKGTLQEAPHYMLYAFHTDQWQRTKDIGVDLLEQSKEAYYYTFDNPGWSYNMIRTTFSLILFIGLLLAFVFFLATGSFIYFKLYTKLDANRKQFEVLRCMGLTNRELKKIVNRQLVPQFFFPWGIAILHSGFAFISLQVIWDSLAEISIIKEVLVVLAGFSVVQLLYFYLIRWRYLVHVRAKGN